MAVVEAFLPLIRKSPAGRIVNVSSAVGSLAHQTDPDSPWFPMVLPACQSSKAGAAALSADEPTGTFVDANGTVGW